MAYTPINWQTGDTITADKLNRCDNGWGVSAGETTVLFSGTVTTEGNGPAFCSLGIELTAQTILVTLDGVEYECQLTDGLYGDMNFTDPPFAIDQYEGNFVTATASTHTIKIETLGAASIEVSQDFVSAVAFHATVGTTTFQEIDDALAAGRLVAIFSSSGSVCELVGSTDKTEAPFKVNAVNVTSDGVSVSTYTATTASSPIEAY